MLVSVHIIGVYAQMEISECVPRGTKTAMQWRMADAGESELCFAYRFLRADFIGA